MVYGYKTNKEFIDKSYQLLEKLNKKHLWDKNTLIVGLDKSVRPLAYTLKKISDTEKMSTPDIKFFNYSHTDYKNNKTFNRTSTLKEIISPNKLSKYKKIIILDEHVASGNTLNEVKEILEKYFYDSKKKPKISLASLGIIKGQNPKFDKSKLIFVDRNMLDVKSSVDETGIQSRYPVEELYDENGIIETVKTRDVGSYKKFIQNREQLSKEIKDYLNQKYAGQINKKSLLEKIIQSFSFISLTLGVFIGYKNITGNVIGNSLLSSNKLGVGLIILGIAGLIFSRKFKK